MLGVTYRTARRGSIPQGVKGVHAGSGAANPTGGVSPS